MLPNLLIIGAGKSGTTSLHQYLDAHPEIAMSEKKELKLFTRDDWRRLIPWYERQFTDAPVRGESSPGYTLYPYQSSTAERIHALIPDAKLIYVVRDPVERAIASYVELVSLNLEDRDIDEALSDFANPANPHLCGSRYAAQLERFHRHFDRGQILVLDHWDLLNERSATLSRTFRFLGVDPDFSTPDFEQTFNPRGHKVAYNRLGVWLIDRNWLTERSGPFKRRPLIRPVRALLSRPIKSELSDRARDALVADLRPEVERLRELTGLELGRWPSFPVGAPEGA